jgi:hypothetical protein
MGGVILLASCTSATDTDSGGANSDGGASGGSSILQVDVPIPDEQTFYEVTDPPPHWPEFIGVPDTLDTSQGFFLDQPTLNGRSLSATLLHEDGDTFGSEVLEQILAMGFEAVLDNESDGGRFVVLRSGEDEVQITLGPESTTISISS